MSEENLIADAQRRVRDGDRAAAILQLKTALQQNPQNALTRTLLGEIYASRGEYAEAEKELERAWRLDGDYPRICYTLGDAMLIQGKAEQALALFRKPLGVDQTAVCLLAMRGEALMQLDRWEEAEANLNAALAIDPSNVRALINLAVLAVQEGDFASAEALYDQGATLSPADPRLALLDARLQYTRGDRAATEQALQKAADSARADDADPYLYHLAARQLVGLFLRRGDLASAATLLSSWTERVGSGPLSQDIAMAHYEAVLSFEEGNLVSALEISDRILAVENSNPGALLLAGTICALQQNFVLAENYLQRFTALLPRHERASRILAYVQAQGARPLDAVKTLRQLSTPVDGPSAESLAMMGIASLMAGNSERASKFLEPAVAASPEQAPANLALADSYAASGRIDDALAVLDSLSAQTALPLETAIARIQLQIANEEFDAAKLAIDELYRESGGSAQLATLSGLVALAEGDSEAAEAATASALSLKADYTPALRLLGVLHLKRNDVATVEAAYRKALRNSPGAAALVQDYSALLAGLGRFRDALRALDSLLRGDEPTEESIVMAARLRLRLRDAEGALQLLQPASLRFSNSAPIHAELGNAHRALGRLPSALRAYQKLKLLAPESGLPAYLEATVLIAQENYRSAYPALQNALRIEPDLVPALIAAAQLSIRDNRLDDAEAQLARLSTASPANPAVALIEASVKSARGDYAAAAAIYRESYTAEPSNFVLQNLVHARWRADQLDTAMTELTALIENNPRHVYARQLRGSAARSLGQIDLATTDFENILELNSGHTMALRQLFEIHRESDVAKALGYGDRLLALAPDDRALASTLSDMRQEL